MSLAVNQFEDLYLPCNQCLLCGAKTTNPFLYQKFGLRSIVYRNGHPIAGTPLETDTDKKMYLHSMGALAFLEHGHGISFEECANHYMLVFDLTSTHCQFRQGYSNGNSLAFAVQQKQQVLIR